MIDENILSTHIWVDVTSSSGWNRAHVGVTRTESAIANILKRMLGDRYRQCIWNGTKYIEYVHAHEKKQTQKNINQPRQELFHTLPKKAALISIAQGMVSLAPRRLRPTLNLMIRALRFLILKLSRGLCKASVTERDTPKYDNVDKHQPVIFSPGDTLISMAAGWNSESDAVHQFFFLRKIHNIKVITLFYDLIPILYPQYCLGNTASNFGMYVQSISNGSDLVLTISQSSRRDLINYLDRTGARIPDVEVISLGDTCTSHDMAGKVSDSVASVIEKPFVLYVSTLERRKNHEVLYRAYHKLFSEGKGADLPDLVFVGMVGWGISDLINDIQLDPFIKNKIKVLSDVSDNELAELYKCALFCVYPSLYEGWGLPVREALAANKPLICSNTSSIPESAAGLAVLVEPWDVNSWKNEIFRMATDQEWRTTWEKRIKRLYTPFTWEDCGKDVYRHILSVNSLQETKI